MNKRGISAVVATVLMILLTIVAIGIIWLSMVKIVDSEFEDPTARVEIVTSEGYTFYDKANKTICVQVTRSSSDLDLKKVRIIFTFDDGNSFSMIVEAPGVNGRKTYCFGTKLIGGTPISIKVAPVFTDGNKEIDGPITSELNVIPEGTVGDLPVIGDITEEGGFRYICGNGVIESGEQCDFGDVTSGDGCSVTCQIEFSGLSAAFWSFEDGSGTTVTDSSGNGNLLIFPLSGSPPKWRIDGGYIGDGLWFDGREDYVNASPDPSLDITSEITITAWINPEATGQALGSRVLSKRTNAPGGDVYALGFGPSSSPICQNGVQEIGETCDDGNPTNGDGCSSSCQIEGSTLAGYWQFDDGPGATTADVSGNGNTANLFGDTSWTSGFIGGALYFDRDQDFVEVPLNPALDITGAITLSAWVNIELKGKSGGSRIISKAATIGGTDIYALGIQSNSVEPFFRISNSTNQKILSWDTDLLRSKWNYITGTYDGSIMRLYIDGVEVNSTSMTGLIVTSNSPLHFGDRKDEGREFGGKIDDVRIYNVALSGAEVLGLYNSFGFVRMNPFFIITSGGTETILRSLNTIPQNSWSHITGTYDRSNMRLYINGILDDTVAKTGSIDVSNTDIHLGDRKDEATDRRFSGIMDEVRLYNISLTAQDVLDVYNIF